MKNIILFLLFCSTVFAQKVPVAGENFTLEYDPSVKDTFSTESKLTLVYVFDQWGTTFSYFDGKEGLFKNVLNPDEKQKKETAMRLENNLFKAEISIPDSAQLLSYYFTDGKNFDYNDKKTYVSYIYNKNGKPVKGARFKNVDFLIMAGADPEKYISELENEIKDYPDFHLARAVLWEKRLQSAKSLDEITSIRKEFEKEFTELKNKYPDNYDFMNAEGRVYYSYLIALSNFLQPYYEFASNKMFEIAKQIPDGKRSAILERNYQSVLKGEKYKKLKDEIINKLAFDFEFVTLDGAKRKLSDYKGKTVLLDFWGTWCGPCVAEIPNLVKVYKEFKDDDFEIISISSDLLMNAKTTKEFKKFVEQNKMNWVLVLDDKKNPIQNLYSITHWPTLFLIDKNGVVIKNESVLRGSSLEETLKEVLSVN